MRRALPTRSLLASVAFLDPCKPNDLNCRLAPYLTALYVIAGILAIVLIAVVAAAVQQYRRNKHTDLKPE